MLGPDSLRGLKTLIVSSLPFVLSGCFLGMYFPSSVDVELTNPSPLQGPAPPLKTLAIAYPLASEALVGLTDASRGKLDLMAIDLADQLHQSSRFTIITPSQYQTALASSRPRGPRPDRAPTDAERKEWILAGAKAAKADGVILLQGKWESPVSTGEEFLGRPEYRRQVVLSLIATATGETVWSQEATAIAHEGIALLTEEELRKPVVRRLAKNILETIP